MQDQLREFHTKFGAVQNSTPTVVDDKTATLRSRLIEEEVEELLDAIDRKDLVDIADGIADSLYVIIGTAVSYGIDAKAVFDEVHRSNMTKVWPDGTVHHDMFGKVIKPPTYSPADLKKVLYGPR